MVDVSRNCHITFSISLLSAEYSVCDLDSKTSDTVPIIVGCLLALLVLVVLGAYLVGRHRARRTGYASV